MNAKLIEQIKQNKHPQFILDNAGFVTCKCGHKAVDFRGGFLCGTITAYPCDYNKLTVSSFLEPKMVEVEKVKEWVFDNGYKLYNDDKILLASDLLTFLNKQ